MNNLENKIFQTQSLKRNFSKSEAKEVAKLLAGDKINFEIDKELKKYKEGDRDSSFHIWQWLNTSILN